MTANKTYTNVWQKYLPVIKIFLKKDLFNTQFFEVNKTDFGGRVLSGHDFRVIINNCKQTNKPSGSVVGDNLVELLLETPEVKKILAGRTIIISMRDFQLSFNEQ